MAAGDPPPPPDEHGGPDPDVWGEDPWDRDDWKRDPWKEADWGKPAVPPGEGRPRPSGSGLANWNREMVEAGPYLTLGLQSAFGMAFFVGLGYVADQALGTRPWGIIAGAVLGMVAVISLLVRLSNQANAEAAARRTEKGEPPPA
ncbi:MAG: AtpZ/AtpI family protein [Rubricoccaceae bacterium]|nr:AtpZ/AtpI family protein [Rubricoccaceae bacterium]